MDSRTINRIAQEHAKRQLGPTQYAENKDAVKAIVEDFKAGANWAFSVVDSKGADKD